MQQKEVDANVTESKSSISQIQIDENTVDVKPIKDDSGTNNLSVSENKLKSKVVQNSKHGKTLAQPTTNKKKNGIFSFFDKVVKGNTSRGKKSEVSAKSTASTEKDTMTIGAVKTLQQAKKMIEKLQTKLYACQTARLQDFYMIFNPSKISSVPDLMKKYTQKDDLANVFKLLRDRYMTESVLEKIHSIKSISQLDTSSLVPSAEKKHVFDSTEANCSNAQLIKLNKPINNEDRVNELEKKLKLSESNLKVKMEQCKTLELQLQSDKVKPLY